jgi:hypothetical protein
MEFYSYHAPRQQLSTAQTIVESAQAVAGAVQRWRQGKDEADMMEGELSGVLSPEEMDKFDNASLGGKRGIYTKAMASFARMQKEQEMEAKDQREERLIRLRGAMDVATAQVRQPKRVEAAPRAEELPPLPLVGPPEPPAPEESPVQMVTLPDGRQVAFTRKGGQPVPASSILPPLPPLPLMGPPDPSQQAAPVPPVGAEVPSAASAKKGKSQLPEGLFSW